MSTIEVPIGKPQPPTYGQCKCCLKNTYLRNMWEAHKNNGEIEVYGQMLVDCFSIDWTIVTMEDDNMCQVCITKLRVSNIFKKQVLESQAATLEAAQVEEQPENDVVLETAILQNDETSCTEEVTIPLTKDLITVPMKKVCSITSLREEILTPPKDFAKEKSSDEENENSLKGISECLKYEKSESDTEIDATELVEFLEEDCLDDFDDDDEASEPNKKKRKRTRNLQTRNQRTMYKNYPEDEIEKAVEAVKSGQMSKREAATVFNVPRESIAATRMAEKNEAEQTESEKPAQIALRNGNTEVRQEVFVDRNEAKHIKINNQLVNGDKSNNAVFVTTDRLKCASENDPQSKTDVHKTKALLQHDVTSTILENKQINLVSEILSPDNREDHLLERDLKEKNIPVLKTDSKENKPDMQESQIKNDSVHTSEVQVEIHVETPESNIQQEITLETPILDPQNGTAISEDIKYVLMEIEPDQVSIIPNNVSAEDILQMHKANIMSIMAASNATPIRGHWGDGFACYFCSQQFADPADLKQHTYTHDNLLAIKVKSVSDHVIKLDVTALKCNICDGGMDSLEDLMGHLNHEHGLATYLDIPNHILSFDFSSDNMLRCVKCFGQFQTFKDLSDHMSDAHYRNSVCIQCDQGFVNVRSLKTHSIKHGISIFICSHCPDYFYSKEDVVEHENATHPIEPINNAQDVQSQHEKNAKLNMDKKNDASYNANLEKQRTLRDKSKIVLNIVDEDKIKIFEMPKKQVGKEWNISVNETNVQYKCTICLKMFKSSAALSFHTNLSHQHKCHICKSVFDMKFDLQRHMRKVHPSRIYECPKCSQKFSSQKLLEVHIAKHEYCCELCSTKFSDEDSYMTHMKDDHGLQSSEDVVTKHLVRAIRALLTHTNATPFKVTRQSNGFICFYCGNDGPVFLQPDELRHHTHSEHPDKIRRTEFAVRPRCLNQTIRLDVYNLKCECSEKILWEDLLDHLEEKHQVTDTDEARKIIVPYELQTETDVMSCVFQACDYSGCFSKLDTHVHEHFPNFICGECGKPFANIGRLKRHEKLHEIGEYPCEECDLVFTSKKKRKFHQDTVHAKKLLHKCSVCPLRFESDKSRSEHLREDHKDLVESKGRYCNLCGNSYWPRDFTWHMKFEHDKHTCKVCGWRFDRVARLKLHRCQPDVESKKFKCGICSRLFFTKQSVLKHMSKAHSQD